jgi:hypothetical protein
MGGNQEMIGRVVITWASRIRGHRIRPHRPHLKKIDFYDFSSFFHLQLGGHNRECMRGNQYMIGCAVMPSANRIWGHRTHPHRPHLKKIDFCEFSSLFKLQLGMPAKHMERESPGSFFRTVAGPSCGPQQLQTRAFTLCFELKKKVWPKNVFWLFPSIVSTKTRILGLFSWLSVALGSPIQ